MYNLFANSMPIMLQATRSAVRSRKYYAYFLQIHSSLYSFDMSKSHHYKDIITKQCGADYIYFRLLFF